MQLSLKKNRDGPLVTFNALWDHQEGIFREETFKDLFDKKREEGKAREGSSMIKPKSAKKKLTPQPQRLKKNLPQPPRLKVV